MKISKTSQQKRLALQPKSIRVPVLTKFVTLLITFHSEELLVAILRRVRLDQLLITQVSFHALLWGDKVILIL